MMTERGDSSAHSIMVFGITHLETDLQYESNINRRSNSAAISMLGSEDTREVNELREKMEISLGRDRSKRADWTFRRSEFPCEAEMMLRFVGRKRNGGQRAARLPKAKGGGC